MRMISADKLKAKIMSWNVATDDLFGMGRFHEREIILQAIEESPTFNAVPVVRGRWRTWEEQFPDKTTRKKNNLGVFCSACQLHADNMTNYCPNCGAKMESEGGT